MIVFRRGFRHLVRPRKQLAGGAIGNCGAYSQVRRRAKRSEVGGFLGHIDVQIVYCSLDPRCELIGGRRVFLRRLPKCSLLSVLDHLITISQRHMCRQSRELHDSLRSGSRTWHGVAQVLYGSDVVAVLFCTGSSTSAGSSWVHRCKVLRIDGLCPCFF